MAVLAHGYALAVALTVPQSLPDTMLYHLPRAALWKQQQAVGYVPNAPDSRIDIFAPGAEIQAAASMILSRGDRYVALVQLLALVAACLAIAGIARRLGFSRGAAVFGAPLFATFTVVLLQTPTALNDLAVAAFLIVCAYFAEGRRARSSRSPPLRSRSPSAQRERRRSRFPRLGSSYSQASHVAGGCPSSHWEPSALPSARSGSRSTSSRRATPPE